MPFKSERGFNLFTALVSFLLITLSVLLINGMLQSERNAATRIGQEQSMAELQAVSDMARADAIQIFNYGLRKAIEEWMTDPQVGGITLNLSDKSWDEIKQSFAEAKFGGSEGRQFANFTAATLEALFYSEAHFGNYAVSLTGDRQTLEELLQKLTAESVKEDDFFQVIGCETGDPKQCPKGTFYVNLKVTKLSQEDYERLPKLRILNKATGDEIKEVILPRANFRIYVPLRVFKAIAEARALAHYPLSNGQIDHKRDRGLFSGWFHNMVEEMGLGLCDKDNCAPRTNPFAASSDTTIGGKACPGDGTYDGSQTVLLTKGGSYNPHDAQSGAASSMETVLQGIVKKMVCDVAKEAKAAGWIDFDGAADKFELVTGGGCIGLQEVEVVASSRISKNIVHNATESATQTPGGGYTETDCSRTPYRKIGLYLDGGKIQVPAISSSTLSCTGSVGTQGQAQCTEIKRLSVRLWFKELDPTYMVDKTMKKPKIYNIKLVDNSFVPFTANWTQDGFGGCFYSGPPTPTDCKFSEGWTCSTQTSTQAGQTGQQPTGCVPA